MLRSRASSSALRGRYASERARSPRVAGGNNAAYCARSSSCGACAARTGWASIRAGSRKPMPPLDIPAEPSSGRTPIAVFARAPVAGKVKTRLIPRLGAERAAALQHALIGHTLRTALAADVGPVSLWCAPDCEHPAFIAFANE